MSLARCRGTQAFPTWRRAAQVAARMRHRDRRVQVYRCSPCQAYHVGGTTRRPKRRAA